MFWHGALNLEGQRCQNPGSHAAKPMELQRWRIAWSQACRGGQSSTLRNATGLASSRREGAYTLDCGKRFPGGLICEGEVYEFETA